MLVGTASDGLLDARDDLFGLSGEEVERSEDGAVGAQLVVLHDLVVDRNTLR